MIETKLQKAVAGALKKQGIKRPKVVIEHPADFRLGDYATNAAMAYGKKLKISPLDLARKLVEDIKTADLSEVEKIEIAGFGFINFFLTRDFFAGQVKSHLNLEKSKKKGRSQKVVVEYTDPNPFKELHIGHLMNNIIGEALAGIYQDQGAEVKRACYSGDVGLHVAKAIYGISHRPWRFFILLFFGRLTGRVNFLGQAYQAGQGKYEEDGEAKKEIDEINKKIYEGQGRWINFLYRIGRKWSLAYFKKQYELLGTEFDFYFFESQTGGFGMELVREHLSRGVFRESRGAIIFPGQEYGLHDRVFINSAGLPTYEAKDLGLAKIKYDTYPYDRSIIVTNKEVEEYFKVVLKALGLIWPDLESKTTHVPHGTLRLPEGKMSSRAGTIITAERLIKDVTDRLDKKMSDRPWSRAYRREIASIVAVSAIKYTVLRQAPGRDIVFDFGQSLSLEGDSGPYLLYTLVRARSVLAKVKTEPDPGRVEPASEIFDLERLLYRFDEVLARAKADHAPHYLTNFLVDICASFNAFYARHKIIDSRDEDSDYKVLLTKSFARVLERGFRVLGFKVPEQM